MVGDAGRDLPLDSEDYGQADYSTEFGYDPAARAAVTNSAVDPEVAPTARSWMERASEFFSPTREPAPEHANAPRRRRRGPSDRVLWAVIVERLEDEHRLDVREVEVVVENAEVTLNGTVRHKEDRRRIEDVADIRGVRHVQNNLRVRGV